jgi:hypothetical protein
MNKLLKIIISNILILFFLSVSAYAVTGAADVYKVTMRKVELCTGSTGVSSCDNAVVIGTGDKEVDIASVDAGASAASYGEPALLPLGVTYTHMRVTIDRKFTIRNSTAIAAGENATACRTIATTDDMYGLKTEALNKYTHKPVVANNQTAAEMNVYLVNDQYTRCNVAACSGVGGTTDDQSISYAQGTGSSKHQTQHADGSSDADHVMIYELTSPYTVALIAPKIDISFGTSAAVSAQEVNELCQIWAEEPIVTITIK